MRLLSFMMAGVLVAACSTNTPATPKDPNTAPKASIDRFTSASGTLMVRSATPALPAANAPINFDGGGFLTQGFSPSGKVAKYYNFDARSTVPAPIFVFFKVGGAEPIADQLNIVDVIPTDPGYNDFWNVVKVTVPADYVANSVTSMAEIVSAGYPIETTPMLVNCPVVPEGSTAALRGGTEPATLHSGWYKDTLVKYFTFEEKAVTGTAVPVSDIYVSFNINPGQTGGGPSSGFKTETGTGQTHNVLGTTKADAGYSPLWSVSIYDNANFATVRDLATASAATILGPHVMNVNCPLVSVAP